jgi:hypothetical protein
MITGNPTSVYLESEDIAPSLGFSSDIGSNASFYYSVDLPSYPCNAKLSTEISEGVAPNYDSKFRQIASANDAFPVGTAYTATITKTNFPSGTPVKIYMSVNSSWRPSLYGDYIFIWRIADDETYGQILPTHYRYSDPVQNLDYYEADSPLGLSTIGISATTGNNNPFQMIAFVATKAVNSAGSGSGSSSTTGSQQAIDAASGVPVPENNQNAPVQKDSATPEPTIIISSKSPVQTNVEMYSWIISFVVQNPVVLAIVIAVFVVVAYFGWYKRRL